MLLSRTSLAAVLVTTVLGVVGVPVVDAADSPSELCPTIHADLLRRQLGEWDAADPYTVSDGTKHTPYLTLSDDGTTATIVVGNGDEDGGVYHPMTPSDDPEIVHFVTHMYVVDQDGTVVAMQVMDPSADDALPATMVMDVPEGVTSLTPYEFCNLHGLWKGPEVTIPSADAGVVVSPKMAAKECAPNQPADGAHPSFHADFLRQQASTFESETPFVLDDGEKHTPFITIDADGKKGSIVVGNPDGAIHPMKAFNASDPATPPHWITDVYVVDQDGNFVAYRQLDPTDVDIATLEFDIPEGVEEVTAYSWCNLHGLWKGPAVKVVADDGSGGDDTTMSSASGVAAKGALSVFSVAAAALAL